MSKRRIRLTEKQYNELTESRDWCKLNGFSGLERWYNEELAFQAKRRALPAGAREYQVEDEERPRGRR